MNVTSSGYEPTMTDDNDQPVERTSDGTTVIRRDDDRREVVAPVSDHRDSDPHLSETEVIRLRTMLNDGSFDDGTSRFKWFIIGFLTAFAAIVVAAGVFLAVSDDDDDGQVNLDVPTVDVDG